MEGFKKFLRFNPTLVIAFLLLVIRPTYGQMSTICTTQMLLSFSPCINFMSNGGGGSNGNSPTSGCCDALKSLMNSGRDCLCLIVTGGIPFRVPINRTIAASLPRACRRDGGVPIECKAMGSPLPSPGPSGGPPQGSDPQSPWLPEPNVPDNTPGSDGGGGGDGSALTPPGMTPDEDQFPMTPPGVRPDLSATASSKSLSSILLFAFFGAVGFMSS